MVCCFFDDAPIDGDFRARHANKFQISMAEGCYKNQPVCCLTFVCTPCCTYYTRHRAIDGDMTRYVCCQGYLDNACFKSGSCGEKSCPEFCLVCESTFCCGPSMSSSRMYIMDRYQVHPDPCDNQIVRFNNCIQALSCICDILAIVDRNFQQLAHIIDIIANLVFYTTMGCMSAQVNREIDYQREKNAYTAIPTGELVLEEPVGDHGKAAKLTEN